MTSLTVHHLENSRSQRVLWLLEELGVSYELVRYERDPKTKRAPPELRKLHPLGKSPLVTEGDMVLAESGAILEHLVEGPGQGQLRPEPGTEAHRRYRFWLHYAEGSLMAPLLVRFIFGRMRSAPLPFFIKPVVKTIVGKVDETYLDPELSRHVKFIEDELSAHEWFAGDEFSAADVQMSFPLQALMARGAPGGPHAKIDAFLRKIEARPAYKTALERGGPFDLNIG